VAAFINEGRNDPFHATQASKGKVLLPKYSQGLVGFLLCNMVVEVQVN
jgi:hypothetical protein